MSIHNICFCGEIRKIICGYPLLSVAMFYGKLEKIIPELSSGPCHKVKQASSTLDGINHMVYQFDLFSKADNFLFVLRRGCLCQYLKNYVREQN